MTINSDHTPVHHLHVKQDSSVRSWSCNDKPHKPFKLKRRREPMGLSMIVWIWWHSVAARANLCCVTHYTCTTSLFGITEQHCSLEAIVMGSGSQWGKFVCSGLYAVLFVSFDNYLLGIFIPILVCWSYMNVDVVRCLSCFWSDVTWIVTGWISESVYPLGNLRYVATMCNYPHKSICWGWSRRICYFGKMNGNWQNSHPFATWLWHVVCRLELAHTENINQS